MTFDSLFDLAKLIKFNFSKKYRYSKVIKLHFLEK